MNFKRQRERSGSGQFSWDSLSELLVLKLKKERLKQGILLACACWQFCKGQILSCWEAVALLFTVWSPHHSHMGFCINRAPDIWFLWHYQNRTSSPAHHLRRVAGVPSSHINISQHIWWLYLLDAVKSCVCDCSSVCVWMLVYFQVCVCVCVKETR